MAKLCKKCGAPLKNDVPACSRCGEAVFSNRSPVSTAATPTVTKSAPASPVRKKLTISEQKERKARKKAQRSKGTLILLIVDLILLLLVLITASMLLNALGVIHIPLLGN